MSRVRDPSPAPLPPFLALLGAAWCGRCACSRVLTSASSGRGSVGRDDRTRLRHSTTPSAPPAVAAAKASISASVAAAAPACIDAIAQSPEPDAMRRVTRQSMRTRCRQTTSRARPISLRRGLRRRSSVNVRSKRISCAPRIDACELWWGSIGWTIKPRFRLGNPRCRSRINRAWQRETRHRQVAEDARLCRRRWDRSPPGPGATTRRGLRARQARV